MDPKTYTYKRAGGCEIKADVYRPSSDDQITPVIVWFHGGALIYGSRHGIIPQHLSAYLATGHTVVCVDHRLAPETKLADIIEDIEDAIAWLRGEGPAQFHIDPARLAVIGQSAGGYLTLMSGFRVQPPPTCLVSFYGYGDLVGEWYSKPDPFYCSQHLVTEEESGILLGGPVRTERGGDGEKGLLYLYCRQKGLLPLEVSGHDPNIEPDYFARYCPDQNVGPDYPPTLLLHGDKDTDVPHYLSQNMATELTRHGVDHQFITIQDGGHGFDADVESPVAKHAFEEVLGFLQKYLG